MSGFGAAETAALAQLLRAAARSEIMPRFRRLGAGGVRLKSGKLDPVTDADEAAEALIAQGLTRLFPGCLVVGEEAAAHDPALIGQLADAELAFAVDPIDGTLNFAAGLPLFGVMAAAVMRGRTVAAVILDPVTDSFSSAIAGEGAWEEAVDGSRSRLRVAPATPLAAMAGCISWRFLPPEQRRRVLANLPRIAQAWEFRCAAHAYRLSAAGQCDFLVFNRLMPWDHLPGCLLHQEAGGHAAKFDGSAYLPGETGGGLICTADRAGWEEIGRVFVGATQ